MLHCEEAEAVLKTERVWTEEEGVEATTDNELGDNFGIPGGEGDAHGAEDVSLNIVLVVVGPLIPKPL